MVEVIGGVPAFVKHVVCSHCWFIQLRFANMCRWLVQLSAGCDNMDRLYINYLSYFCMSHMIVWSHECDCSGEVKTSVGIIQITQNLAYQESSVKHCFTVCVIRCWRSICPVCIAFCFVVLKFTAAQSYWESCDQASIYDLQFSVRHDSQREGEPVWFLTSSKCPHTEPS